MKVRVFGTPCGGTQYTTAFLKGLGLEVGHERWMPDGIVCGFMALGLRPQPKRRSVISHELAEDLPAELDVHLARHPLDVAETLWRFVSRCPREAERMRAAGLTRTDKEQLTALQWWVCAHEAILERKPDCLVRIGSTFLGDWHNLALRLRLGDESSAGLAHAAQKGPAKTHKRTRRPRLTWDEWRAADPDFARRGARLVDYFSFSMT